MRENFSRQPSFSATDFEISFTALARKGLSEPGLEREALRRIAGAVERSFMGKENKSAGTDALKGR